MVVVPYKSHIERNIKTEVSETAVITVRYLLTRDREATMFQRERSIRQVTNKDADTESRKVENYLVKILSKIRFNI